jgi:hypothetical protein
MLRFSVKPETRVLDVGGSPFNWLLLPTRPDVTLLNVCQPSDDNTGFTWLVADGRFLPFKDFSFNVVFSNSVIEHLGRIEEQRQFASECRRLGHKYYVQTPNRKFFMEPHFITPFLHWLPVRVQRKLLRNFTVWGLMTRPSAPQCDAFLNEIHLLDETELQELFPDAEIWRERFLGFTKSLIAAKTK